MNTKNLPAIIMLIAGLIDSVISIYYRLDMLSFTKRLLFVLVIFYILGIGVKIILDKAFPVMTDEETEEAEESEETDESQEEDLENIDTENAEEMGSEAPEFDDL